MKYVLDAFASLCWVIPRPLSPNALRLRDDFQKSVYDLIAPAHYPGEIASVLTKALGHASKLIGDVLSTLPILHPLDPIFYRAVEISSQTRIAFCDCLYVALAEQETCELVTADDKLIIALQGRFAFVLSLASFP